MRGTDRRRPGVRLALRRPARPAPARPSRPRGSDDPEPTRMMPRDRPPAAEATSDAHAAPPGGPPPSRPVRPPSRSPPPKPRRPRRKRPVGKIVLLLLVAWIAYLVAVPVWASSNIDKVDVTPTGARPADQPGTTYLLVGSDSRKGLTAAENKKLGTGGVGDVGQRTDTIMLLHTGSGPSLLLSIPRDSLVPIPGHGTTKINAAFAYGGPKLLVKTIEQNTGRAHRPLRRDRLRRLRELRRRGRRRHRSARRSGWSTRAPTCASRRAARRSTASRRWATPGRATSAGTATSTGPATSARWSRAIGAGVKSPWTFINPVRYFRVNQAATSSLRGQQGHRAGRARPSSPSR